MSQAIKNAQIQYVEVEDIQTISVMGEARWVAKAKFPKTPRGKSIVIFQFGEELIAIPAFCPHEQANMAEGLLVAPFVLQCPLHHNEYDLRTGAIKAFKVEMIEDKMFLAIGAEITWGTPKLVEVPSVETSSAPIEVASVVSIATEPIVNVTHSSSSTSDFSAETAVKNRSAEEKNLTLEKEIALLLEASLNKDRQLQDGFVQMDKMVTEMENKKNEMEKAHKNLKAINDFVQRVTNSMSEILIILDADGKVKEVNRRFSTLLGFRNDEISGKYLDILFQEQDLDVFTKSMQGKTPALKESIVFSAFLANPKWESEINLCDKKGTPFVHLLRSNVIISPSGKKEGVVIIGTDIRMLKEIQKNLNVAYEKVSALLNNMRQGIFVALETGEIIEPVSSYTRSIFGEDITNKSIFETLFRDLDRKSEAFIYLQTAFSTVFNEDEIQWSLMEDIFPRKLILSNNIDKKITLKVLKIEYCPMWKDGALERIMFVIEDVTQLEQLEKQMEEERLANLKNIEILQELAKNKVEDLKEFFENSYQGIEECRRLTGSMLTDDDTRNGLFRNLHTLKGNARVLGLKKLAQVTHEVESEIERFKHQKNMDASDVSKSDEGLSVIKKQLTEYGELAEKVFNIKNEYEERHINEIHQKVFQLDVIISGALIKVELDAHSEIKSVPKGFEIILSKSVFGLFEDLYEEIRSLGDIEISAPLGKAIEDIKVFQNQHGIKSIDQFLQNYREFTNKFLSVFWNSRAFTSYTLAPNLWVQLYQAVFELSEIIEKAKDNVSFASKSMDIETSIEKILASASAINHETIENLFVSLPLTQLSEWSHRGLIEQRLQQTWKYLAFVSNLETATLLASKDREALHNYLIFASIENEKSEDDKRLSYMCTFMGFLNSNYRKGISIKQTLYSLSFCMATSINEIISAFIAPEDSVIDKALAFHNPISAAENFRTSWTKIQKLNSFSDTGSIYLREVDYFRAILSFYKVAHGNVDLLFENVQSFNVVSSNFQKLIEIIEKIPNSDLSRELSTAAKNLLDIPLIPMLYKYHPMIQEVSGRLNKKVDFKINGETNITVPRQTAFLLQDAFVHLLRNALDHGLEDGSTRKEQGKSEKGTIHFTCTHSVNGQTQIILSDDGKGIDADKVLLKSIKMGLVDPVIAAQMSEMEKVELIFKPHLTTSENVSDLSGRGVGMDVVKRNIEQIGKLEIKTKKGFGTDFIITLN